MASAIAWRLTLPERERIRFEDIPERIPASAMPLGTVVASIRAAESFRALTYYRQLALRAEIAGTTRCPETKGGLVLLLRSDLEGAPDPPGEELVPILQRLVDESERSLCRLWEMSSGW